MLRPVLSRIGAGGDTPSSSGKPPRPSLDRPGPRERPIRGSPRSAGCSRAPVNAIIGLLANSIDHRGYCHKIIVIFVVGVVAIRASAERGLDCHATHQSSGFARCAQQVAVDHH